MNIVQLDKNFSASCLSYNLLAKKQQDEIYEAISICREFVIEKELTISGSFAINTLLQLHRKHEELSITVSDRNMTDDIIAIIAKKLSGAPIKKSFTGSLEHNVDRLTLFGEHIIEIVYLEKEEINKIKAKNTIQGYHSISIYYNLLELHSKLVDAGRIFGREANRSFGSFSHIYCEKLLSILRLAEYTPNEEQQEVEFVNIKKEEEFIKRIEEQLKTTESIILYAKSAQYFYEGKQQLKAYIENGRPYIDIIRPIVYNLLKPIELFPKKCEYEQMDIDGITVNIYDNQHDVHFIEEVPTIKYDIVHLEELFIYMIGQYINSGKETYLDEYFELIEEYVTDNKSVFYFGYNENIRFISEEFLELDDITDEETY